MRPMAFLGSVLALSAAAMPVVIFRDMFSRPLAPLPVVPRRHTGRTSPRRRKTTRFPHSSACQRARYARQIAAGQLRMEGC